jgi:hypothetical protein
MECATGGLRPAPKITLTRSLPLFPSGSCAVFKILKAKQVPENFLDPKSKNRLFYRPLNFGLERPMG